MKRTRDEVIADVEARLAAHIYPTPRKHAAECRCRICWIMFQSEWVQQKYGAEIVIESWIS